MANELTVMR